MSEAGRIRKHSLLVAGHQTSVTLEDVFWEAFKDIARARGMTINALAAEIDDTRTGNLSSAIRIFVFENKIPADN